MKVKESSILKDVKLIELVKHSDKRGYFIEKFNRRDFENLGIYVDWKQDNISYNELPYVLRGLHFQKGNSSQAKLVSVLRGSVYDVIVDLRKGSPSYGKYEAFLLSEENQNVLYVPTGFAHGYLTLEPDTLFSYKVNNYYDAEADSGIIFNDPTINIKWEDLIDIDINDNDLVIKSEKDLNLQTFKDYDNGESFVY